MKTWEWCAVLFISSVNTFAAVGDSAVTPTMAATAQKLMELAQQENEGYALVRSLTTEVGPRLAGTAAEVRARRWAVEKLSALGFQNVRIEPFDVPVWIRGEESAEIVAPFPSRWKLQPWAEASVPARMGSRPRWFDSSHLQH